MAELYLSGCVFYQLIKEAAYASISARQRKDGLKNRHNDQNIMTDLVYAFTGDWPICPKSDVSRYRAGKIEGSVSLPFNNPSTIASYDDIVRIRYSDALIHMTEFADWHLNPIKRNWLIRALFDIIINDKHIRETDMFYVQSNGSSILKRDMRIMGVFEYQSFLVGILHYILTKRAGKNSLGVSTLDAITVKIQGQERKYAGHLGEELTVKVHEKGEVIEEALLLDKTDDSTNDNSSTSETVAQSATNPVIHQQINFTGNNNAGIVINGGTINF